MNTSEYLSLFVEESIENIKDLNDILLELENRPDDKKRQMKYSELHIP